MKTPQTEPVFGCLRAVVGLVLVVALAVGAWLFRDELSSAWNTMTGGEPAATEVSPEMANAAEAKLERLSIARPPERVALSDAELQSLVQYRMTRGLPAYLLSPRVGLNDGMIEIDVRVPTKEVPRLRQGNEVLQLLPDTTDVAASAQIIPLSTGRVGLAIDEVSAARIPVPNSMIPGLLERLGRTDEPGLPDDAISIRLPNGASTAFVRGDSLILLTGDARTD